MRVAANKRRFQDRPRFDLLRAANDIYLYMLAELEYAFVDLLLQLVASFALAALYGRPCRGE